MASCFPEMRRGISKWRVVSRRCGAESQSGELLAGETAWHLKVASCFPEMLRGISKWRVACRRCGAASQSGELLAGDAARHLKMASCFPEMLRSISKWRAASRKCCTVSPIFDCPLSVSARCIKYGARVKCSCFAEEKNYRRQAIDFAGRMPDFERRIVILDFRFFGSRRFYKVWG